MQAIYLCRYFGSSGERVGSMNGDWLYDLNLCAVTQLSADYGIKDAYRLANRLVPADLREFLAAGDSALSAARRGLQWVIESGASEGPTGEAVHFDRNHVTLKAPIVPDTKVICMGDTYVSHAELAGAEQPDSPGIFFKMSGVVVGPDEFVVYPKNYHPKPLVYDTEMTVVIGKDGMSIAEDDVDDHIWGYTVLNDLTLRGVKDMGPRYKCFESSAPVGPWIVPKGPDRGPLQPRSNLSYQWQGRPDGKHEQPRLHHSANAERGIRVPRSAHRRHHLHGRPRRDRGPSRSAT